MKVSDIVNNKINRFKTGYVFTYEDFDLPVNKIEALKKTLSRLVTTGKIIRLSKGQFYKPEKTEFGILRPLEYQIVKDLLEEDNKLIGYLTAISVYNRLGLTTQVSNTIQIGTNIDRKPKKRGIYNIRFIRQKNTISKDNIYLLQILDSIRFIKRIPDVVVSESFLRIIALIKDLSEDKVSSLAKYAQKYNPGTRALTGAILDHLMKDRLSSALYDSLNPATEFDFNIGEDVLMNKQKWRIS